MKFLTLVISAVLVLTSICSSAERKIEPARVLVPEPGLIAAPYICQGDDYPNGCESVSAVMALRYFGFDISVDTFIDNYLDCGAVPIPGGFGQNPNSCYLGDPRSPYGWGCYAPVIARALRRIVPAKEYAVWTYSGMSLGELCRRYIKQGVPVILWATVGMEGADAPEYYRTWMTVTGKPVTYNSRLHCLLLVGCDDQYYYFNDPLTPPARGRKATAYPRARVERAYEILGSQSVVIVPRG